jgi:tetratricopeptide (TPR) repeat protein
MTYIKTRMASILFAFGIFFAYSCSSINQNTSRESGLTGESKNQQSILEAANATLIDDPGNADALLFKINALYSISSQMDQPEQRYHYYLEMKLTSDQIMAAHSKDSELNTTADSLLISVWNREQGQGVRLLSQFETLNDDIYSEVVNNFENAILVNPDSSSTYNLLATTHYQKGDLQAAIQTLEQGYDYLAELPLSFREKLAFLYLEAGQIDIAIQLYENLAAEFPGNEQINHGLINAYILGERHSNAVQMLREQIARQPYDLIYHESLATELFFLIRSEIDVLQIGDTDEEEIKSTIELLIVELLEAEEHFQEVLSNHPDPAEILYITASFYKNTAAGLHILADKTSGELEGYLTDEADKLLRKSLPLWEQVLEFNPENMQIWNSLMQIYIQLGMTEEAEEIRTRMNLQ